MAAPTRGLLLPDSFIGVAESINLVGLLIGVPVWEDRDGQVSRFFAGTKRGTKVRVNIASSQNADGMVAERVILASASDCAEVDADAAREIAADLWPRQTNSTR